MSCAPTTYCTPQDVARILNLTNNEGDRLEFGFNATIPTTQEIEQFILDAEGIIDEKTHSAFGSRYTTITDEYHDLFYDYFETSVHLVNPNVITLSNSDGDKLELFNGSEWVDWITDKTEGRGDDFYVDYRLGKIYFRRRWPRYGRNVIRATYRYQKFATVPYSIKVATVLEVGMLLVNTRFVGILFPEGESSELRADDLLTNYENKQVELLKEYIIGNVGRNLSFTPIC